MGRIRNFVTLLAFISSLLFLARGQTNGQARLVNGATEREGRVEFFWDGRWGTVCERGFGTNEGNVVCLELGFGHPVSTVPAHYFGVGSDLTGVYASDLLCHGIETKLTDCPGLFFDDVEECDHDRDVGLICSTGNETEGDICLVGSGKGIYSEGRVEILRGNVWGTVCHHGWDLKDAKVVCRQLGHEFATLAPRDSAYGPGDIDQIVLLSEVGCEGTEARLLDCPFSGWGVEECEYHEEDAGVVCADEPLDGSLRLVDGIIDDDHGEGRLEVYHNGAWGTVCIGDTWSHNEALVACRHLGYDVVLSSNLSITEGNGMLQLDGVNCYGYELTLTNCAHGPWQNCTCSHTDDVGISCGYTEYKYGDVRLVGGYTPSEGRIELYNGSVWGTVCDNQWDLADAVVSCRQMGYLTAREATMRSYFGEGYSDQPVLLANDVYCTGFENTLTDCYRSSSDLCENHLEDAGAFCTDQGCLIYLPSGKEIYVW